MEVHHHSHTAFPETRRGRKKWNHYIWEFLMLFLAVFCGFLAEYRLEHMLEKQRGKQYARTMLEDLKADKEALESGIRINKNIILYLDTLLSLYNPAGNPKMTTGQLYYYGRSGKSFWYYVNKQVTLAQMKFSGTIRYFQNSLIENHMVEMDKLVSFIKYWDDRDAMYNEYAINYSSRLFDFTVLNKLPNLQSLLEKHEHGNNANTEIFHARDQFLSSSPPLVSEQPALILEFLNFCNQRIPVLKAKVEVYADALTEMDRMTAELKKEYRLE